MRPLGQGDPARFGPFRLVGVLGGGGMGRVYLGRSAEGRNVAVKTVRAELADDRHFRSRFAREVAAARQVHGPFVARVVAAEPHDPTPWMATEYLPGLSLTDVVHDHGPLPEHTVRPLLAGLVRALAAVHAQDLVHRDVKPSNVLLTANGPRLIDFGIARSVADTVLTNTGTALGTPGLMAPEQLMSSGPGVTGAVDVFALGGLIVHALTGSGPFGTADAQVLMYRTVHEEAHLEELSGELRDLAGDCLAKDPGRRPSLEDLAARIGPPGPYDDWLPGPLTTELLRLSTQLLDQAHHEDPAAQSPTPQPPGTSPPPSAAFGPPPNMPPAPAGTMPGAQPGPGATPPAPTPYPGAASWPTYPGPAPLGPGQPAGRGSSRRGLLLGLGAAVVVGGAGTLTWLIKGNGGGDPQGSPSGDPTTEGPAPTDVRSSPSGTSSPSPAGLPGRVPAEIRQRGVLEIASTLSYEPLSFSGDSGPDGLEVDLAHALAKQLGLSANIRKVPFEALMPMLRSGGADAAMSAQVDGSVEGVDYVDYFRDGRGLVVRKGNPQGISRLADLAGKRVGVVRGAPDHEFVERWRREAGVEAEVVPFNDFTALTTAVAQGEVAVFFLAHAGADVFLSDYPGGEKLELTGVDWEQGYLYGIVLPEEESTLRDVLRDALNRLLETGEYQSILKRWKQEKGAVRTATINGEGA